MRLQGPQIVRSFVLVFLALPISLAAEEFSKLQVFGGYQYQSIGGNLGWQMGNPYNGWNSNLSYRFSQHFGATGDFSGNYHHGNYAVTPEVASEPYHTTIYTFAGGPVYYFDPRGKIAPFVHALFGGAHITTPIIWGGGGIPDTYGSENGFTSIFGGGVDYKYKKSIAIRLIQFDWLTYHNKDMGDLIGAEGRSNSPDFDSNVRISTGLVFHF